MNQQHVPITGHGERMLIAIVSPSQAPMHIYKLVTILLIEEARWEEFSTGKMMRFCKECNNLLYPRENRDRRKLEYACKAPCTYVDRNVTGSCVFMNELVKDSS